MQTTSMSMEARIWGRALRALVGAALMALTVGLGSVSSWDLLAAAVVLPLLVTGLSALATTSARMWPTRGGQREAVERAAAIAVVLLTLAVATALTFVSPMDGPAVYLFVGFSMLVAAGRGYGGCEVLALPRLVLGTRMRMWCPLFSPVDRLEKSR